MVPLERLLGENPEEGARVLVAEYGARLYAAAYRLCLNETEAEDLTFRTLAQAVRKIRTFNGKSSLFTWLCSILANFHRMERRKKGATALVVTPEIPESADAHPNPKEELERKDELENLRRAVRRLPEELRAVVVYFYFGGLRVPEIAAVLKIPEGTIYYRLHEARGRIREILSQGSSDTSHLT